LPNAITPAFCRLAAATALVVYLLIVAGGVVRITGSGLGCPDWPLCHGRALPPPELAAIIEYAHRILAALGGGLLITTAGWAWLRYRPIRRIVAPATAAVALLAIQVPLGAWVVATELDSLAVAFHLGMALLILGGALVTAVVAQAVASPSDSRIPQPRALLASTLAALFLLMISGALVVGSGAARLCPTWPLCGDGIALPSHVSPGEAIHLLHRYTVVTVTPLIGAVVWATLRKEAESEKLKVESESEERPFPHFHLRLSTSSFWALTLGGLFAVQVGIGAAQVVMGMPVVGRALHLAAAAGVWAALVILMTDDTSRRR